MRPVLSHLYIDNLIIVDRLELPLQSGMTVITGETGAGKSIMLDAIGLALGERASPSLIGAEKSFAEVSLTFDLVSNSRGYAWLNERDLLADDSVCLLRRTINQDGRSRAWINGRPATLADLRQLGGLLLDLYSQHEHQSLLKKDTQRRLLDDFGGLTPLAREVESLFDSWQLAQDRRKHIEAAREQDAAERQLLEYQLRELASLAPETGEYVSLLAEQKQLANSENVCRTCMSLAQGLSGEEQPLLGFLAHARQALEALEDEKLHPVMELLSDAEIQLEEAARDLRRLADQPVVDPRRVARVDERLTAFFDLGRKHKVQPEALTELRERLSERLQALDRQNEDLESIRQQEETLAENWRASARRLSQCRAKAAGELATGVSAQLQTLGIQGHFEVRIEPLPQLGRHGQDAIEFQISTNIGAPLSPLARIASGGELSRISLAIQVLASRTSEIPTLIFDEVDAGIGGAVAEIVGSLLRKLAEHTQVITVTHLGQVACHGHNHFTVRKSMGPDGIRTQVSTLDEVQRVTEIARMLGGVEVTPRTLDHAREMYLAVQAAE